MQRADRGFGTDGEEAGRTGAGDLLDRRDALDDVGLGRPLLQLHDRHGELVGEGRECEALIEPRVDDAAVVGCEFLSHANSVARRRGCRQ